MQHVEATKSNIQLIHYLFIIIIYLLFIQLDTQANNVTTHTVYEHGPIVYVCMRFTFFCSSFTLLSLFFQVNRAYSMYKFIKMLSKYCTRI